MRNTLKKMSKKVSNTLKKMRNKVSKTISRKKVNNTTSNTMNKTVNKTTSNTMNNKIERCKKIYCNKKIKNIEELDKKKMNLYAIGNTVDPSFYLNKETYQKAEDTCYKEYCNPTCKNTILESGKLSNKYRATTKFIEQTIPGATNEHRKEIFGNKTTVLKNGFYEKVPNNIVEKAKKKGIISVCTQSWM